LKPDVPILVQTLRPFSHEAFNIRWRSLLLLP
jgi:hypothetical protein